MKASSNKASRHDVVASIAVQATSTSAPPVKRDPMASPARVQVDPDTFPDDKPAQTGTVFNIWYLKWSGGGESSSLRSYTKLKFRVSIAKDAGYTTAKNNLPICLFFARGCCYLGKKCLYHHRLPRDTDYIMPTQDCFGRDKTAEYRDDMDGVGSFNTTNRTLYVGGLHMSDSIENTLTKHFQEFGSIEKIRALYGKSCAFVTFRLESEAQFAKEAMQNQSLDGKEVLNIRWANEDPNPVAQLQEKARMEEIAMSTVKNLLAQIDEPAPKKQKVTVEEPEEQVEEKNTSETKAIEFAPQIPHAKGISFSLNSLSTLAKLKAKKEKEKTVQSTTLIAGYSSDEEED
ncbi:uncharacterized protein CANTADRAFT_26727 [Suhomyces tanzawaensis NRRL Y-17324]|uniref:Pre-mRNA-splicing factor CWC2 n=1 Tax=Suhomyces tanzawaensis NRRL Y-17324 TaxID=984487 RepID=A0A1E4SH85_9ASCO|nr:uncharacterized protein CANTADRAFT_26727 [Suhomyces tanzawaensis NRRL Y-17324]ODV78782.1 hypothetical protein CANTADRAFT_26727 [Suhomyces tanzawaensis NRRL Y-17324]